MIIGNSFPCSLQIYSTDENVTVNIDHGDGDVNTGLLYTGIYVF